MSDIHPVRDLIWQAADEHEREILRKKWQGQQVQPKEETMQTATFNYLDSLVSERIEQIEAAKAEARRAESERVQAELRSKHDELRRQFKPLIEKGIATVNNGALHFSHDATSYSVFRKEGEFVLNGGSVKEMKLTGDGDLLNKLVNSLASLRTF